METEFNETYLDKIINGDSLEIMKQMPDKCLDLVVTSPPYNILNTTGGGLKGRSYKWRANPLLNGYDNYKDNIPEEEYDEWQHNCLVEMYRLLKDDGAIFYNHKWRVQNGLIQDRKNIIRDLPLRQIIIWRRSGGINFNRSYFLPTYEVIYLIPKPKFQLVQKAIGLGDVWDIKQERNNDHPAPFPVELVDRIISSTEARIILDPFMGSGTTAVAAIGLNRHYIGIDISQKYCEMAEKRIKENVKKSEIENFRPLTALFKELNS